MYNRHELHEQFAVNKLVTFHYDELGKDYVYPGERHDFWEFLYVDKGEFTIATDRNTFYVKQGDLIFYSPDEFHSLWSNGTVAPNILILSFECEAEDMSFFTGKHFHLDRQGKAYLSNILREGLPVFDPPASKKDHKGSKISVYGNEQMVKINLESLLIHLVRKEIGIEQEIMYSLAAKGKNDHDIVARIVEYLEANLSANLNVGGIAEHFNISKTRIKLIFKEKTGLGLIEYYDLMKIEQVKKLIREKNHTFTQIAELLGYSSIHYFSRHFTKMMAMTPSEYARSLKHLE